jgi:hypothetical protein
MPRRPTSSTTILHYLGTRVEAEVFLPAGHADPVRLAALSQRLDKAPDRRPLVQRNSLNQRIAPK